MTSTPSPGFGWWESAAERRRLLLKVQAARYWVQNANPETPHTYASGLMNAVVLLDEAVDMMERFVEQQENGRVEVASSGV